MLSPYFPPASVEHIEVDNILIDGNSQGDIGDLVLKDREMLGEKYNFNLNLNI